jgi:hypothetical protein
VVIVHLYKGLTEKNSTERHATTSLSEKLRMFGLGGPPGAPEAG